MNDDPVARIPSLPELAAEQIAVGIEAHYGLASFRVGYRAGVIDVVPRRSVGSDEIDRLLHFVRCLGFRAYHLEGPQQRVVVTRESERAR